MKKIQRIERVCACGCGGIFLCRPNDVKRFLNYHQNIGAHHSPETLEKLRIQKLGDKNPMKRKEVRQLVSAALKGRPVWNKGKPWSAETLEKLRTSHIGNYHSTETRKKMSLSHRLQNHWNWQGGKSFEPYPLGWNKTFKEQIRYRDGYRCQVCGVPESETGKNCDVHHIDYVKENLKVENLISLCHSCHAKTNSKNRGYWIEFFSSKNPVASKAE